MLILTVPMAQGQAASPDHGPVGSPETADPDPPGAQGEDIVTLESGARVHRLLLDDRPKGEYRATQGTNCFKWASYVANVESALSVRIRTRTNDP